MPQCNQLKLQLWTIISVSDGFKKEAFDKDNKAFITNVIPPRAITEDEEILTGYLLMLV
jgi:hypothetical protein